MRMEIGIPCNNHLATINDNNDTSKVMQTELHIGSGNGNGDGDVDGEMEKMVKHTFDHITEVSFGKTISDDEAFVQSLMKGIKHMYQKVQAGKVEFKIIRDAFELYMHDDIRNYKKDDEKRQAFEASFVFLLSLVQQNKHIREELESFQATYFSHPDFKGATEEEFFKLFHFRSIMKVALQVINPNGHKQHLLDLVTRIVEGKGRKYVTGSGQTLATTRRVTIYEKEGNIKKSTRPSRRLNADGQYGNEEFDLNSISSMSGTKRKTDEDFEDRTKELEIAKWMVSSSPIDMRMDPDQYENKGVYTLNDVGQVSSIEVMISILDGIEGRKLDTADLFANSMRFSSIMSFDGLDTESELKPFKPPQQFTLPRPPSALYEKTKRDVTAMEKNDEAATGES